MDLIPSPANSCRLQHKETLEPYRGFWLKFCRLCPACQVSPPTAPWWRCPDRGANPQWGSRTSPQQSWNCSPELPRAHIAAAAAGQNTSARTVPSKCSLICSHCRNARREGVKPAPSASKPLQSAMPNSAMATKPQKWDTKHKVPPGTDLLRACHFPRAALEVTTKNSFWHWIYTSCSHPG